MTKRLTIVKLGGSVITDKHVPDKFHFDLMEQLAGVLADYFAKRDSGEYLLLAHGGGSFAHYQAKLKHHTPAQAWSAVRWAMQRINHLVMNSLLSAGLPAIHYPPSAWLDLSQPVFASPVLSAMNQGLLPVIHGDQVPFGPGQSQIVSTEQVIDRLLPVLLTELDLASARVLLVSNSPVKTKQGQLIGRISDQTWPEVKTHLYPASGFDVTGGMQAKVKPALAWAKQGVVSLVLAGKPVLHLTLALQQDYQHATVIK